MFGSEFLGDDWFDEVLFSRLEGLELGRAVECGGFGRYVRECAYVAIFFGRDCRWLMDMVDV